MLKLSDNPPILSPLAEDVRSLAAGRTWWVAHTLSRFEKAFAADMLRHNIGYFLPLVKKVTYSSGRKRISQVPLFPGYVFICGDVDTPQAAVRTNRLCQILEVADSDSLVEQLSCIHTMIESGCDVLPQTRLVGGDMCRVTSGPLEGIEGVVDRSGPENRLIVNVKMLGRGAAVEIEASLLEKIQGMKRGQAV